MPTNVADPSICRFLSVLLSEENKVTCPYNVLSFTVVSGKISSIHNTLFSGIVVPKGYGTWMDREICPRGKVVVVWLAAVRNKQLAISTVLRTLFCHTVYLIIYCKLPAATPHPQLPACPV